MGRQHSKKRRMVIKQSQKRQIKLKRLREKYNKSENSSKKEQILNQVNKIAPWLTKDDFLTSLSKEKRVEDKKSD